MLTSGRFLRESPFSLFVFILNHTTKYVNNKLVVNIVERDSKRGGQRSPLSEAMILFRVNFSGHQTVRDVGINHQRTLYYNQQCGVSRRTNRNVMR